MKDPTPSTNKTNLLAALVTIGCLVAGIWGWHYLSFDTQDYIIDKIIPVTIAILLASLGIWLVIRKILRHRQWRKTREQLIQQFEEEPSPQKRVMMAFELVEFNRYELKGLENIVTPMAKLFLSTLKTALGDKQHRIRGMAASYLGVLQYKSAIPPLIRALEDDHAHVRACAALALGRMKASAAKPKLEETMKEDWDQTVRSRAREAVERIP